MAKNAINSAIAAINKEGELVDLHESNGDIERYIFFDDKEGKSIYWHSTSHLLAQAVKRLYPRARLAIGPAIEEGFYYDFDIDHTLNEEDLKKIEEEMQKIIQENLTVERKVLSKEEAKQLFSSRGKL